MGRALLTAAVLVLAAGTAAAQAPPGPDAKPPGQEKIPPGRSTIHAGDALSWQEDDVTVTFMTGGVTIKRTDLQITCARALAWSRKGGGESFEELYAEGGVVFEREKQTLRCERFYFNVQDEANPRAVIMDFRGEAFSGQYKEKFYVRAKEAHMVTKGRFKANDITLTTCSYGVPHYHLSIGEGTLVGVGEHAKKDKWDLFPFDSWKVGADEMYPELMGAPVFFIPAMTLSPALSEFPLRHVEGGHNSRFGYYALTDWGIKLRKADDEGHWRPWADVKLEVDWREFRGGGYGLGTEYKWKNYQGYIKSYFMYDLERDPDLGFNAKFGPLERHERGLAHVYHRQEISDHWRLELESYYVPDRDIREEFFTKEFREDKDPETAAFLRWSDGPVGAFLYERYRLNNWQTQNEYLPRVGASLYQIPIARGPLADLYLTQRLDAGRIRRVFDDDLNLPSETVWRVDSMTEVSLPIDARYFQVAPYAQERLTFYDEDLQGESRLRSIPGAGVRISTQLHATWPDITWDGVGLRGLRHIMELEGRYGAGFGQDVSSQIITMDDVDRLAPFEEVQMGMHHRFKTRDENGKPFEFLSLGVEVEYYPNSARDTTSFRVDDYLLPYNYIMVSPKTDGSFPERHWSNVHYGMTFQPRNYFQVSGQGEYNPAAGVQEVRELSVTVWPMERTSLSFGQTYLRGITNAYTGSVSAALTEKWTVSVQGQYDFRGNEFLKQRLVVSRDFHDFLLEGVLENDTTTNEHRIFVAFIPKFLGEKGERRSHVSNPVKPSLQYSNPEP